MARPTNPTFPTQDLRMAEKELRVAFLALGRARDRLADTRDPRHTALGMPDQEKLKAAQDATTELRNQLETHLRSLDHIRQTGGCGRTSDAARSASLPKAS